MRHLVYLLLVVNLVYLGWNVFESGSTPEQVRHLPPLPVTVSYLAVSYTHLTLPTTPYV